MRKQRAVKPGKFLRSHGVESARLPMYSAPQQAGNASRANLQGLNRAEFGHWTVVPTDDHHITLFDLIQITGQVSLGFLNIHSCHAAFQLSRNSGQNFGQNISLKVKSGRLRNRVRLFS